TKVFTNEVVVALELELYPKSHKRYRNIFLDYSYRSAIHCIFYVVKSESIMKPVALSWMDMRGNLRHKSDQRLLLCVLDEILNCPEQAKIYHSNGTSHLLPIVFKNYQTCPSENSVVVHPLGDCSDPRVGNLAKAESANNSALRAAPS